MIKIKLPGVTGADETPESEKSITYSHYSDIPNPPPHRPPIPLPIS